MDYFEKHRKRYDLFGDKITSYKELQKNSKSKVITNAYSELCKKAQIIIDKFPELCDSFSKIHQYLANPDDDSDEIIEARNKLNCHLDNLDLSGYEKSDFSDISKEMGTIMSEVIEELSSIDLLPSKDDQLDAILSFDISKMDKFYKLSDILLYKGRETEDKAIELINTALQITENIYDCHLVDLMKVLDHEKNQVYIDSLKRTFNEMLSHIPILGTVKSIIEYGKDMFILFDEKLNNQQKNKSSDDFILEIENQINKLDCAIIYIEIMLEINADLFQNLHSNKKMYEEMYNELIIGNNI